LERIAALTSVPGFRIGSRMKVFALALLPMMLLGCAIGPAPPSQVHRLEYQAHGRRPIWELTIGDDRIVLRISGGAERVWPRTEPRIEGRSRRWQSGEGTNQIAIETWNDARNGICNADRAAYEDHVAVQVDGRTLTGCGGNLISSMVSNG
jgi:uncharacterized membrane protein